MPKSGRRYIGIPIRKRISALSAPSPSRKPLFEAAPGSFGLSRLSLRFLSSSRRSGRAKVHAYTFGRGLAACLSWARMPDRCLAIHAMLARPRCYRTSFYLQVSSPRRLALWNHRSDIIINENSNSIFDFNYQVIFPIANGKFPFKSEILINLHFLKVSTFHNKNVCFHSKLCPSVMLKEIRNFYWMLLNIQTTVSLTILRMQIVTWNRHFENVSQHSIAFNFYKLVYF